MLSLIVEFFQLAWIAFYRDGRDAPERGIKFGELVIAFRLGAREFEVSAC